MNECKAAVVGVRNIGAGHARAWASLPGVRLVAVADLDARLRAGISQELNVPQIYADYQDLLDKSDAEIVSVCLPTGVHEQVVTECLRSGRHVLCEKPPAQSAASAARMRDAALAEKKVLGYSLQRRFQPGVRAARRAVQDGRVGDLFYGRVGWVRTEPGGGPSTPWRLDNAMGGGSLLDIGVHLFDAAWYIMGCPAPHSVSGFATDQHVGLWASRLDCPVPTDAADMTAAALIRFHTGQTLLLESSFGLYRSSKNETYCDLSGSRAGLKVYPDPTEIVYSDRTDVLPDPEGRGAAGLGIHSDFLRAVESGGEPCVSADQGVVLMRILDGIRRSAAERRDVVISQEGA